MTADRRVDEGRVAQALFDAISAPEGWMVRRVDSVTFLDATTARRAITCEFEVPPSYPTSVDGAHYIVPIGLLKDGVSLHGLVITDEQERRVFMLNRKENKRLTAAVLQHQLEEHKVREPAVGTSESACVALATDGQPDLRRQARERLAEVLADAPKADELRRLVDALEGNYLVLVAIPAGGGALRSVTVSFDEDIDPVTLRWRAGPVARWRHRVWLAAKRAVLWSEHEIEWEQFSSGDAPSFHVEVRVPPELELTAGEMHVQLSEQDWGRLVSDSLGPSVRLYGRGQAIQKLAQRDKIEVELPDAGLPRDRRTVVRVRFRPRSADLLSAGVGVALVSGAMLLVGAIEMESLLPNISNAAALLVAVPSVAAVYLALPSQHALTSRVFRWPRVLLGLVAVVAFGAGFSALFAPARGTSSTASAGSGPTASRDGLAVPSSRARPWQHGAATPMRVGKRPLGKGLARAEKPLSAPAKKVRSTSAPHWLEVIWAVAGAVCLLIAAILLRSLFATARRLKTGKNASERGLPDSQADLKLRVLEAPREQLDGRS